MKIIKHRINWIEELKKLPAGMGAEVDIRTWGEDLHMAHDAFEKGELFLDFLEQWSKEERGTLILNTKEDGLEDRLSQLMLEAQIEDYFFLDTAAPTLIRHSHYKKDPHFAIRISEFEPTEALALLKDNTHWVWLDSFSGELPSAEVLEQIKSYKVCLVSPELQGRPIELISQFKTIQSYLHSVCTKRPDLWS